MNETHEYLWTTEKDNYILIKLTENKYSIFNTANNAALIIEDDEEDKFVIKQMRENGNRVIRIELLKYLLDSRPIPTLIGIENEKAVYRCPDTGEKFELDLEYTSHVEPEFDIAIKWSNTVPLTRQIIHLKRIFPNIEINTPELLHLGRTSEEYVFAKCCSHFQASRIIKEGKKSGLDLYVVYE